MKIVHSTGVERGSQKAKGDVNAFIVHLCGCLDAGLRSVEYYVCWLL